MQRFITTKNMTEKKTEKEKAQLAFIVPIKLTTITEEGKRKKKRERERKNSKRITEQVKT